ncbi:voltage-dependent calcium channel beta subunit-associated regulatory protein [Astyanax mexicanus]|uniref:voltage-dependent calcium channel beta subunit-associated regulatory protein n=1 Tax=Astyanax mexicanus TaxID=7994 RepID=UPI0020CB67E9|nr:voltage-dependent calcium channel beta subunit-associated regulatory protein [Astyanax mexicanus]
MSDERPLLTSLTENATDVPVAPGRPDNYVLLLVMLCVFAGGTLVLLSVLLIFCHRCCQSGRRYSRASDDLEKTNTTYVEESQPTQDITIRLESTDTLSTSSYHGDGDGDRFQSTAYTGRRVSFNESAIYDQNKKSQEKGRRYTLTEGDFHHLKKARLTHLHIAPPAMNILTIMECDSPENSITLREQPQHKPSLSIFQPVESGLPDSPVSWSSQSPSCALPGDTFNSILDSSFTPSAAEHSSEPPRSRTMEVIGGAGSRTEADPGSSPAVGVGGAAGAAGGGGGGGGGSATGQGTMLHFLSRLRRHASLEGASPYFTIKKWKFDSSHRAASLDMRGSPRRRTFQRQRAASETLDQTEEDSQRPGMRGGSDILLCALPSQTQSEAPRRLSASSLEPSAASCPPPPPAPLSRLEVKAVLEASRGPEENRTQMVCSVKESLGLQGQEEAEDGDGEVVVGATGGEGTTVEGGAEFGFGSRQESLEQPNLYRDIWSLRASLEQYASSDLSSNDRDSTRSDADSVCSLGGAGASRTGVPSYQSQDMDDEIDGDGELPYDDVGREVGGRKNGRESVDSERGSDSDAGSRKLLQMDSGYASIEAPCKAPEELRLFGSTSGKTASERRRFFTNAGRKGTVCESFETRLFKEELEDEASGSSVSVESEALTAESQRIPSTSPRGDTPEQATQTKPRPRFRRRDYSIDEKTEALFNEFLRHDPQFDQQGSPSLRHRHRSRIHLRKQWQRTKQYSDPGGARYSPSLERQRSYALRRGDSANYPLDTRYHSTLPRIASAADEEASEGGASEGAASEGSSSTTETPKAHGTGPAPEDNANNSSNNSSPLLRSTNESRPTLFFSSPSRDSTVEDPEVLEDCGNTGNFTDTSPSNTGSGQQDTCTDTTVIRIPEHTVEYSMDKAFVHSVVDISPSDKLMSNLDERLYTSLRRTQGSQKCMVAVTRTSPDLGQD